MGTVRLGKRTDDRSPLIKDFVPLASLEELVFGGWDIYPGQRLRGREEGRACSRRATSSRSRASWTAIKPWPAVFDPQYVKKLNGPNVKKGKSKRDLAEQVSDDIARFKKEKGLDRLVMVWCGSTEVYREPGDVHSLAREVREGARRAATPTSCPR